MNNTNEKMQQYEISQYRPIPLADFDFPVGAALVDLSQLSMHMVHWHWHEEVECILAHEDPITIQLPDKSILLAPGEAVFLTQNLLHSVLPGNENASLVYSLKFHPTFLFSYGQSSLSVKYLAPVLASAAMQHLVITPETPDMKEMLRLLRDSIDLFLEKPFGHELLIKGNLCTFWGYLLSFARDTSRAESAPTAHASLDSERIKKAILFIQEKHMEQITLEDIAHSIHVSKSECCRCFQRALGLTAFDYLLKYRIFESTRKIMRGDKIANSISSLAASVGFNNASYYNKIFKKYLGCTPTEYKQNLLYNKENLDAS